MPLAVPVVPPPGYWQAVQTACRRHGTLLILDEIPKGATGKVQRIGLAGQLAEGAA